MLADAAGRLKPTDRVLEIGCGTGATRSGSRPAREHGRRRIFRRKCCASPGRRPAPDNLRFVLADAETAFDGGPFDAICAFQVLHLVDDLPGLLSRIHAHLKPGGLLIAKTWCFADMGLHLRGLFLVLRLFGLFPPAEALTKPALRRAIGDAGFEIVEERVFGKNPHGPYIVARKAGGAEPGATGPHA